MRPDVARSEDHLEVFRTALLPMPRTTTSTHSRGWSMADVPAGEWKPLRPYAVATRGIVRAVTPRPCRRARGTTRARRHRRSSRRCSSRAGPSDDDGPGGAGPDDHHRLVRHALVGSAA
jgi:hypothetical protein